MDDLVNAEIPLSTERPPVLGISFVIPARNEAATIKDVVSACHDAANLLSMAHEVIVVSDGSVDRTESAAREAGARVVRRRLDDAGSKAEALKEGVLNANSNLLGFLDADCIGLTGEHIARLVSLNQLPEVVMAVGTFDYRIGRGIVQRFPWSAGERIISKELFPLNDGRLRGYNVEALINEAVGRRDGLTVAVVMDGVRQRTKVQKFGLIPGVLANIRMWRSIARQVPKLDLQAYRNYSRKVMIARGGNRVASQSRVVWQGGFIALRLLARMLG
jgi:glycosyltransferase involved in cell wall biosynthesis